MKKGQVYKIHSDFYYVNFEKEIYECKIREILKKQKEKVLVGDFVEFEIVNSETKTGVIYKIIDRTNFLTRPSVANVEQVVIVSAIKEPDLDFEQLNRYICFAKYHNIPAKLCFNKNDLSEDDSIIEKVFKIYEPLGFEIVFTSALDEIGIDDFVEIVGEKTTVFCGASGVGKSTLINKLCPDANLRTGKVSDKTERGTHTTRHCEILESTFDGSIVKIIDTPGFSSLKFDFIMPNEVDLLFDDIAIYKSSCKYADCLHLNENNCAVLANIAEIESSRYESYVNFVNEAKEYKEKVKFNGRKVESFNKENQNKSFAKISSRKRQASRNTQKQNLYKDFDE
ncbi:MAG: ribosome small subunit-dependent GTPase A [bacterium]|nr:ribosome small subunit-dependent GTPase A [bacterium]